MKVNITLLTMITWAARRTPEKLPEEPGGGVGLTFEGVVINGTVHRPAARLPPPVERQTP